MRSLCVIADTHRKHRELVIPECDLLIHCGDICSFEQEDQQTLEDIDLWFSQQPAKQVVCVGGNHDFLLHRQEYTFTHATLLEDELVEIDGLSLYGSPWCPELLDFAYYATEEELVEKWRRIPSGIDVLITHTPPHGVLDEPRNNSIYLGCPHLRDELRRIKPRLHVFGHIHACHGMHTEDGIQYINAAVVAGRDLDVVNGPTIVNISVT